MNKQHYLQQIKNNFPQLKFSKSRLITSGFDDDVIILDEKIVFSFPKQKLDCAEKFQKELNVLPLLNKVVTLPIPNFIYIPKDKSFAGYKYIAGIPLTNKILKTLSPQKKEICAKQIALFLSQLHSFPTSKAKKNGVTQAWVEQDARDHYTKRAQVVFRHLDYDFTSLKNLLATYPLKPTKKLSLTHQDLTSDHILFNSKTRKINGIIDFGDLEIADPAIDLSKLWDYGEEFLDMMLSHYTTKDKDIKERSLRWWIYHNINLVEFGYEKKIDSMIKRGYSQLQKIIKNQVKIS